MPGESGRFKECVSGFSGMARPTTDAIGWWTQGPSSVKGFPKWCADARDLVKSRTEDEALQLIIAQTPLTCRLFLGRLSKAVNQRIHLGVGGQGSGGGVRGRGFEVWVQCLVLRVQGLVLRVES